MVISLSYWKVEHTFIPDRAVFRISKTGHLKKQIYFIFIMVWEIYARDDSFVCFCPFYKLINKLIKAKGGKCKAQGREVSHLWKQTPF